jgi:quinol-cytochrome oxidoreductase complex cytochrome b subunit
MTELRHLSGAANLNYFWNFGGILMIMLISQIITGIVLVDALHP